MRLRYVGGINKQVCRVYGRSVAVGSSWARLAVSGEVALGLGAGVSQVGLYPFSCRS
ncbi:hypothetical protein NSPZN2_30239 [Nitrospira defluvii]|uniref:Uncharacterized protein n=1 Tax=Nitrospira defluvii TaxID=330214 RepID=A0ABM8RGV6_9BACT|nr:hypothetical protein NSPZN2_30239 [Nitrospira defluvii]